MALFSRSRRGKRPQRPSKGGWRPRLEWLEDRTLPSLFGSPPYPTYAAGNLPVKLAVADFNNDGQPDLAALDFNGKSVSILLGNSDGTFKAKTSVSVGAGSLGPQGLTPGDFNGDGVLDLAVGDNSNTARILLGNGDGTFGAATSYATDVEPYGMAVADLNRDGAQDLAVSNIGSNTVSILLGNGNGSFKPATNLIVGNQPYDVPLADFNGDGKLDLATPNAADNTVSVRLGNGDGTFSSKPNLITGTRPIRLAARDFNNDGQIDLASLNRLDNTVSLFLGNGDATFKAPLTLAAGPSGSNPVGLVAADFNADGNLDLATCNFAGTNIVVGLGNGDGTFRSGGTFTVGNAPDALVAADFNDDGALDLGVANRTDNTVSILLNQSSTTTMLTSAPNPSWKGQSVTLTATVTPVIGTGTPTGTVTFKDGTATLGTGTLSGGKATITTTSLASGTHTLTAVYGGDSNFSAGKSGALTQTVTTLFGPVSTITATNNEPTGVVVADFNGDNKLDFAVGNDGSSSASAYLGNGTGGFPTLKVGATGANPRSLAVADFNGDGAKDLAVADWGSGTVDVYLGNSNSTFSHPSNNPFTVGTNPWGIAAADFNGDGKADLVVANMGSNTVSLLLGNGDGNFAAATAITVGNQPDAIAAGDFNGDGNQDFAVANSQDNTVSVFLGNGNGTFGTAANYTVVSGPVTMVVGDFNGDGKPEIVVGSINNLAVSLLTNDGTGHFQVTSITLPHNGITSLAAGDLNGDGKLDLVIVHEFVGQLDVLLGNGDGTFGSEIAVNTAATDLQRLSSVAVGDFNGDGIPDLVLTNGDSNLPAIYIFLNQTTRQKTWTGGGADANWTNPANWGGVAPSPGDDLLFPAGAARLANTNNFAAGTAFHSITFSGGGYDVSGNAVTLQTSLTDSDPTAAATNTFRPDLTLSAATTVEVDADRLTLAGNLTGSAGVTKTGSGTLALAGTAAYTGTTTVAAGILQFAVANVVVGTGTWTVSAGATLDLHDNNASLGALAGAGSVTLGGASLTVGINNASTTFGGVISGSGGVTKLGTGVWTVSGANSYTGPTTIANGTIRLGTNNSLPVGTFLTLGDANANTSGVLDLNGFTQAGAGLGTAGTGTGNAVTNTGPAVTLTVTLTGTSHFAGMLTGNLSLVKDGTGTQELAGDNSYVGTTLVKAGVLRISTNNALGASSAAATVAAGAFLQTQGSLTVAQALTLAGTLEDLGGTGAWTGPILFQNGSVLVDGAADALTLSGPLTGTGGYTKAGGGALTVSSSSSYSGPTNIQAGSFFIQGNSSLPNTTVAVSPGATVGGVGSFGSLTVQGHLSPGNSPGILQSGNGLVLDVQSVYDADLDAYVPGQGFDAVIVNASTVNILAGSTLNVRLSPNFVPKLGDQFTILQNPGGQPIQGAFTGLAEGTVFFLDSLAFQISYVGGAGHDIVLTRGVRSAVALTASAPAVAADQPVTFTATVSATGAGAGTPTGTLVFAEGANVLLTTTLTNGRATFTTTFPLGNHAIAAGYAGDGVTFLGVTSAAVPVTVKQSGTTVTLTASATSVPSGQPVTFTATVTPTSAAGSGTPTGVVVFAEGPTVLQTTTLTNGQASFATTALTPGSHTIAAGYAGDGTFVGSTSAPVTVTFTGGGGSSGGSGVLAFNTASVNVPEGNSAAVTVVRTGGSDGTVSLPYVVAVPAGLAPKNQATPGVDFQGDVSGTLTFQPGETEKTLALPVAADNLVEDTEYFTITLQPPTGATLGTPTTVVVAILDTNLPVVADATPKLATLQQAGSGFGKSPEHYKDFVTKAYARYLNRTPDDAGFAYWVGLMQLYETSGHAQGLRQEQIEAGFLDSPEYLGRYGGVGQAWIQGIYHDLLGRDADPAGLQSWLAALQGGAPPTAVALGFTTSLERLQNRIKDTYQTLLGREADQQGLAYWVALFQAGYTTEDINSGFVGSAEYFAKRGGSAGNPARWVREAYLDILFRPARTDELAYWLAILKL